MRRFRFALFILAALLLTACQVAANTAAPDGNANAKDDILAENQTPLNVSVALDETRSVEALIPLQGGTLTTSGADGTRYTLSIPADALNAETIIRMVPANLSGMPFGSNPLAVQLYPEGLFFNNFVVLTITPPTPIPLEQQLTFGYLGSGQDVILAPPVLDSAEIQIQILHFSGYGVSKGLLADIEPVRQRIGGDAERRLQNAAAEALGRERQRLLLGGEAQGSLGDMLSGYFEQYQKQVIEPRVAAAGESCAAGRLALQTVLGAERQKQLLGMQEGDNLFGGYPGLMDTVAGVCLKEEYELCSQEHIIHRIIPVWLGFERQYQLLGMEKGASSAILQQAKDLVGKCLTFELAFESQADMDDGSGGLMSSTVNAKVPFKLDMAEMSYRNESALVNSNFSYSLPGCNVTPQRGGSTFTVSRLTYEVITSTPNDALGHVTDLTLSYFPGFTSEGFTIQCGDDDPFTGQTNGFWTGSFMVLHEQELDASAPAPAAAPAMPSILDLSSLENLGQLPEGMDLSNLGTGMSLPGMGMLGGGFVATDWEILGGEYFAKKEWIREDASLGLTEAGTLKLYHRPPQ